MALITLESLVLRGFVLRGELADGLRLGASVTVLRTPAAVNPTRNPAPSCQVIPSPFGWRCADDYVRDVGATPGAGRSLSTVGVLAPSTRATLHAAGSTDGGTRSAATTNPRAIAPAVLVASVAGSEVQRQLLSKHQPSAGTRGRKAG